MAYVPLYRIKEGREKMSLPNMMLENITKRKKHELLFVQYFKMILQKNSRVCLAGKTFVFCAELYLNSQRNYERYHLHHT